MAKQTKRAARKVGGRRTAPKKGTIAQKKTTKRLVKVKPKQRMTKARAKRAVAKKSASKSAGMPKTETVIVDVIEDPILKRLAGRSSDSPSDAPGIPQSDLAGSEPKAPPDR